MAAPRIALVVKRSTWRLFVEEKKDPLYKRLLARSDPTTSSLRRSHLEHEGTVQEVKAALSELGARVTTIRTRERFDASVFDLVVTVGGDGTMLSASHNVAHVPILAINSAPTTSVGFFCGARSGEVKSAVARALKGTLRRAELARMQVLVNGEVVAGRVLNDALFCHASPAATTRYLIQLGRDVEEQKSSGFWIGPAAGSTAAQRSAGGRVLALGSKDLQLVVREPYTPQGERYRLRRALIKPGRKLSIRCKSYEARLFLDGPDREARVRRGDVVEFMLAGEPLTVLGIGGRRRWGPAGRIDDA
ncbi:MAG: NAD(+)/NADH kinase [Polyangiaceae bacterium]